MGSLGEREGSNYGFKSGDKFFFVICDLSRFFFLFFFAVGLDRTFMTICFRSLSVTFLEKK